MSALLKLWKYRGRRKELGLRKIREFDGQSLVLIPRDGNLGLAEF